MTQIVYPRSIFLSTPNEIAAKLGDADDATALGEARTALAVETTTQLNSRDTANRDRANHSGTQDASTITGLATVATSGSYNDLANQPTIPGYGATLANMPAVTSWEFLDWRREIVETKKAPTIWEPTTKYFISSSTGNDSNAGTFAAPWQTIARVQTAIDGLAADSKTVFYFLCGDTWEEIGNNTTGTNGQNCLLRLNKTQVGLSSYGTGAKPFFNRFVNKHTSGWTVHSGAVYVKNVGVSVGWVRNAANRLVPMYRTSSAALAATDVADTSGSFYFDTATNDLYLNLGGTDPNTVTIEIVESNSESLELVSDGTYCENLRLDGFGISATNTATQGGLRTSVRDADTARIQNCEFYFGSSHTIHHNGFTGSGGTSVFIRCVTGFCRFNSAGETIMNSYCDGGNQETYVQDCEVPYGTLPSVDWFNPASSTGTQLAGAALYCHTGGGAATTGFIFVDGLLCNHNLSWGPADVDYFASIPAPASLASVKAISFGSSFYNLRRGMLIRQLSAINGVRINSSLIGRMDDRGTRSLTNINQFGWLINTRLDIDYTSALVNAQGIWNGDGGSTARFYHNRIIQRSGSSTHDLRIDYDISWSGVFANNVVARIGTYDISSGIGAGTTPETDANAFYLIKTGTVGWNAVTISTEAEAVQTVANETSYATYRKAARLPFRLGYDRLGNRRGTTTSIGDLD